MKIDVIISENCPVCHEVKEKIGDNPYINFIDVNSQEYIGYGKIIEVPSVFVNNQLCKFMQEDNGNLSINCLKD